tara:strand:- start:362 stop:1540 length:1179 start_codon:yes stop_codon:yes gene_type:complete
MSNLLFGVGTVSNKITNEPPRLLAQRMAKSSKLNMGDTDIKPLSVDPMNFTFHYYPEEVGQLGDGHYMKFHIFENTMSPIETEDKQGKKTLTSRGTRKLKHLMFKNQTKVIEDKKANLKEKTTNVLGEQGSGSGLGYFFNKDGSSTDAAKAVINSTPSAAEVAKKANEINSAPRDKFSSTHRRLSQSIILYTPPETKFNYKVNYSGETETGMLGGIVGADNFTQMLGAGGAGLASMLSSAMQLVAPGIGAIATRAAGFTTNPNIELAFESVPFRSFTYPFTFAPKNKKELQQVHKIIESFKYHMHPQLSDSEAFFITPSQFEIEYMYRKDNNNYIPRVAKCVLESMDVDYSPNEKFTTLLPDDQGASPQIISIQLQFKEMLVLTKKNVAGGY